MAAMIQISAARAMKLLNETEKSRFEPVIRNQLQGLSEARLKRKASAARTARDKYRDLLKRQRSKTKRKSGSADASSRTREKVQIFSLLLSRIEGALKKRKKPRPKLNPIRAALLRKGVRNGAESTSIEGRKASRKASSQSSLPARKQSRIRRTPVRRILAHQASAGKRNQARRDAR
jgi:hypothetical protein